MNFIFVCPRYHKSFEAGDFQLADNQGVKTDEDGQKYLDAIAILTTPCPHCGQMHTFAARELACPFDGIVQLRKESEST